MLDWAGVSELGSRAEAFGLDYRWLPVPDQGTCRLATSSGGVATGSTEASLSS